MTWRAERHGWDVNIRSELQMREYRAIARRIASEQPQSVLDWGCGWGQVSQLLIEAGLNVTSFDYRPDVEASGPRRLERFPQIVADVECEDPRALPYPDAAFDAVLSCGVLEHVEDPHASLEEIWRVLRPGGMFYVYKLPNRYSYLEWIARRVGLNYHGFERFDAMYDKRSVLSLLRAHRFDIRELQRANMLPLTVPGRLVEPLSGPAWTLNRALSRVPLLNVLATNLELVAAKR